MRIGIFGGSFNPPHNMHKNISLELIDNGYLDKVIYVPTGNMYNKSNLIDFKDRLNMVKLMIQKNDNLDVSNIGNNMDYQYTYQALDYFKKLYNDASIYFICGSDNLVEFDTWREFEYILENYKLLVIIRNGDNIEEILSKYDKYRDNIIITNVSPRVISSTVVRHNIKNDIGDDNIDIDVYKYIKEKKLYK